MGEWEEKLNSILGNQQVMGQIMALADSLSADPEAEETDRQQNEAEDDHFGAIDPELIRRGMSILNGAGQDTDCGTALLLALRPFLRAEKQKNLERAIQLSKMIRLMRTATDILGKEGTEDV